MKRYALYMAAALTLASSTAANRAIYVKDADGFHRYSFGVAGNLKFSDDGKTLYVNGYEKGIKLADVEYVSFDMPTDGQMSSTEHKDKLLEVGRELNSKIHANDAADMIGFFAELGNLDFCDGEDIFADFREAHPDLFDDYDDDDDYYYMAPIKKLAKSMRDVAKGDVTASRRAASTFTEYFTRKDLTGVFEADVEKEKWVKVSDADYFELRFKGPAKRKNYTLKVECSDESTEWSESVKVKESDGTTTTYDVKGSVPRSISCTFTMDGNVIGSAGVKTDLNQTEKSIDISMTAESSGVKVEEALAIRNNGAETALTAWIKGEEVATVKARLSGSRLLNVQEWADDIQGVLDEYELEEYGEYYYEADGRKIARRFGSFVADADILGKVQLQGHVANYDMSYDDINHYLEMDDDAEKTEVDHDKKTITHVYGSEYWSGKLANLMNDYSDASFFYEGKDHPQGFVEWIVNTDIDEDDDWTTDGYWDDDKEEWVELGDDYRIVEIDYELLPVLTFSDGSSFAFDSDYFGGNNFNELVNDAEDIADIINDILSRYEYVVDED